MMLLTMKKKDKKTRKKRSFLSVDEKQMKATFCIIIKIINLSWFREVFFKRAKNVC